MGIRGVLVEKNNKDKKLEFQFNPEEITDNKESSWETRTQTGLYFVDYIWVNGGERTLSFTLKFNSTMTAFLDSEEGIPYRSQYKINNPNVRKNTFGNEALDFIKSQASLAQSVVDSKTFGGGSLLKDYIDARTGKSPAPVTSNIMDLEAALEQRYPRGVLDDVEALKSFLYPRRSDRPVFSKSGIVPTDQFEPPPIAIFTYGEFYFECIVKSVDVKLDSFNIKNIPQNAECSVTLGVLEYVKV